MNRRKLLATIGGVGAITVAGCVTEGDVKSEPQTECDTKETVNSESLYEVSHVKGVYKESPWKIQAGPGDTIIVEAKRVKGETKIGLKVHRDGDKIHTTGRQDGIDFTHKVEVDEETSFRVVLNEPMTAIGKERAYWDVTVEHENQVTTEYCYEK